MTSLTRASLVGQIAYNGFVFGAEGAAPPLYRLAGTPVYDEANRAVTHIRYQLDVSCLVYGENEAAAGARIAELRRTLTRPGRKLEIVGLGLGETSVHGGGNLPDLAWGAKPRLLSLEPVGGTQAWQLSWQCEFNVGEGVARVASGDWLSLTYSCETEFDERGFATRRVRGAAVVAQIKRAGEAATGRSVDEARDRLRFAVPPGFRRLKSVFRVAADQARMEFEIVDEQLRHDPFPPGIVAGELTLAIEQASSSRTVAATLAGWLESAPSAPKSLAALQFLRIAESKRRHLAGDWGSQALVAPSRIAVRRQLFTRRTEFEIEFHVLRSAGDLLALTGLWQPLAESDYGQWRLSLESLWQNRGFAELRPDLSEGAIIDLAEHPAREATIGRAATHTSEPAELPVMFGLAPQILPERSWLNYQVQVRVDREEQISVHSLATELSEGAGGGSLAFAGVGAPFQTNHGAAAFVRERHGAPRQTITLSGEAVRLAFPPAAPMLVNLGGRAVHERRRREQRQLVAWYERTPAYRLQWTIVYDVLDGYLGPIELPPHPD